jgi:hypothetical protein
MASFKWSDNEWEERFDVLFNNITSNQAPGLNTYEKCVLLTKGQDEVLKNHFSSNSQGNTLKEGYDDSPKRQIDFSMLTTSSSITGGFSSAQFDTRTNSKSISLPSGMLMIVNELAQVNRNGKTVDLVVIPLRFDEYNRLMSKPYTRPLVRQAWRLINSDSANKADIVIGPGDTLERYIVRYIRKPKPIIIGNLDGLTLDGYTYGTGTNQTQGCELDPILYEEILQRAVELAKIAWTQTGQDNAQMVVQAGQRSE